MPVESKERKAVYKKRKKTGLCPRCGQKKRKTCKFSYCDDCRAFFRNYNQEMSESINEERKSRYEERKRKKQCPRCGTKLLRGYKKIMCALCLKKNKKNYSQRKK